ncbi:unnamed protein product [Rhizophagus irregularis]|nr:unnamed protein product [Rhizophagus irregularis]
MYIDYLWIFTDQHLDHELNYLERKVSLFLFSLFEINNSKYPSFMLPSFEINVDIKVLPLAWNTAYKPANDNFSQKNINTLTARLTTPLKDNEIPLVEEEINNNSNENNDENIQSILERLEQNIDNQFAILYQEWSNYDSL